MRRLILVSLLAASFLLPAVAQSKPSTAQSGWKARVTQTLPLLGHRNWILIVDSAYPLQSSPGVETIETGANQLEVLRYVLGAIGNSIHVRPLVYLDAEFPFVTEQDAPGVVTYRKQIDGLLSGLPREALPHERLLADVDQAGKQFRVLVLKTSLAIPYTSVFIRLDCKYWSADAEARMRAKMPPAAASSAP